MRRDVLIKAPAAEMFTANIHPTASEIAAVLEPPSPQEIIQAQSVEIRQLQSELEKLRIGTNTIANATVCLVHMLGEERGHSLTEIRIPRSLRHRLDGASVQARYDADEDILLTYVEAPDVVFDGRPDE